MTRLARLLRLFLANAVQRDIAYRGHFLMVILDEALQLAIGVLLLLTLFDHTNAVGGWSFEESLAVYGVFIIANQFAHIVLNPNLGELPTYIRLGTLDALLLKPIDAQLHLSIRHYHLLGLPGLGAGIALVIYAMVALDKLTVVNLLLFGAMMAIGLTILYAIWLLVHTLAFWFTRIANLTVMVNTLTSLGRFPVSAFPTGLRWFFTLVFPLAFIATVPAAAAIGRLDWTHAILGAAIALVLLGLGRWFWRFGLSRYVGASS